MKNVTWIVAGLTLGLLLSVSASAQEEARVIAVINKADWCPVCQEHGERAMAVFMKNNMDGVIQFVANDLTNDETREQSAVKLKNYGLDQIIGDYRGTGIVFFFNHGTRELITNISVGRSDAELSEAMDQATDGV